MAWTERYVRADANGSGDGTTDANSGANGSWTLSQAVSNVAAGHRVNIKAGTYSRTTTSSSFLNSGTTTAPIWLRGYNTTIGDIDADQTLTKPVITHTTGKISLTGNHYTISNLDIVSTALSTGDGVLECNGSCPQVVRCRVENQNAVTGGYALKGTVGVQAVGCWFKATSTATHVVSLAGAQGWFRGCVFTGGGHGLAFTTSGSNLIIERCVFDALGGDGIRIGFQGSYYILVDGCTFRACGSDGIEFTAVPAAYVWSVSNCLFTGNGGYGVNNSSGANTNFIKRFNNAFYSNTSGTENGFGDNPSLFEQVESADPLTSSTDFTLVSGALSKAAGVPLPGTFENRTFTGHLDIGAVQSSAAGAAGGLLRPVGQGGGLV